MTKLFFGFLIYGALLGVDQSYFQQSVHYYIHVTLHPKEKTYTGDETIIYRNNSPDTLYFIRLHLYPNAYKDINTPFAIQQERFAKRNFYFSKMEERGFLKISNVRCKGEKVTYSFQGNAIDEVKINLPEPLIPGDSVSISIDFYGKFPKVFSRMGYFGKGYFAVTQWYPKVVVYDKRGWHPDSYLDQGEFYGEFGKFDVWITVPKCFVVDATGILIDNPEEKAFMKRLADTTKYALSLKGKERKRFIKRWIKSRLSDLDTCRTMKTLHFVADSVHNFAWFAGVQYLLLQERHNNGVLTNVLVSPQDIVSWEDVPRYVERAISFYSQKVGPFRYPKASVVDGSIAAGGGMEYPMITIVGVKNIPYTRILEDVVVHEVGHNWFMGMLGSDERAYPFLDEGVNSFLEYKYLTHYYGRYNLTDFKKFSVFGHKLIQDIGYLDIAYNAFCTKLSMRTDQPMDLRSEDFSPSNYAVINYYKGVLLLRALEWYLTPEVFWKGMHEYYKRWCFKHPDVDDFFKVFEDVSGKDLEWFKNDWYRSTKFNDFVIKRYKSEFKNGEFETRVWIKNKGTMKDFPAPVFLITEDNDTLIERWNADPRKPVIFYHKSPVKRIGVNMKHEIFESNFLNNSTGLPEIKLHFLPQLPDYEHYSVTILPYYWHEKYVDGTRLGIRLQAGNPIIMQSYGALSLYYSTWSKKASYHLQLTNRVHPSFANFTDVSMEFMDEDGLEKQSISFFNYWQKPEDDFFHRSLTLALSHLNLYNPNYYNPVMFEPAKYWSVRLRLGFSKTTMLNDINLILRMKVGLEENSRFIKLENQNQLRHYIGVNDYIQLNTYAGGVIGNTIPRQELIFAFGSTDPEHRRFYPSRRGILPPGRHWSVGDGMNLFGYTNLSTTPPGKFGTSISTTLKVWHLPSLYYAIGVLTNELKDFSNEQLLQEGGIKFGISGKLLKAMLVLPIYVSHPPVGENKVAFRWSILFNLQWSR